MGANLGQPAAAANDRFGGVVFTRSELILALLTGVIAVCVVTMVGIGFYVLAR